MVQSTTPTFVLTLKDQTIDLSEAGHVYFALRQPGLLIQKQDDDLVIEGNVVSVFLSQEDSVKLSVGPARIQLNWTIAEGSRTVRPCSVIKTVEITENLLDEVLA